MQKTYKGPPERAAAYDSLLAFDHCLRIMHTDRGLEAFLPQADDDGRCLREKSILSVTSDHGSEQEAAKWFLCYELGCRGLFLYDVRHQLHREFENATNLAGMTAKMKMAQAILSYARGPYGGAKWFRVLQEEAMDYLNTVASASDGAGHVLVNAVTPRVAKENNMSLEQCTPEVVLDMLKHANFLKSYTGTGNFSRWDEFHSAWRARRGETGLQLLLMLSYCLRSGILKVSDKNLDFAVALGEAASASTAAKEGSATMKEAKAATNALYSRCRNKFHVVCMLLLEADLMNALHMWHAVTFPLSKQLNTLRKDVRGRRGALEMWRSFAEGTWLQVCQDMHDACLNPELHQRIGLLRHEDCAHSLMYNRLTEEHPIVTRQDTMFQELCNMFFCSFYQKCLSGMQFFDFPHQLVLLTNGSCKANEVCQRLDEHARAFEAANRVATKWCKEACRKSPLQLKLVQDVLQVIRQNHCTASDELQTIMTDCWSNLAFTLNEEGFRAMRSHEEDYNEKHAMPSIDGWSRLSNEEILSSFGYAEVVPDDADVTIKSVPSSFFHTRKLQPSTESLRSIMNRRSWPSLSPLLAASIPAESALMIQFFKSNQLPELVNTWRTRFLQRGLLVKDKKAPNEIFFSLGPWPTCTAALCVMMQKITDANNHVYYTMPQPLRKEHLHWKCVERFADWQVVQTMILSPLHTGILNKVGAKKKCDLQVPELPGIWRERAKTPVPLLKHAASHAYWDISNFYLKMLLQD